MIEIRQETKRDYADVYHVVEEAFKYAEHTDGNEQNLVVKLRQSDVFVSELSLVAVTNGKIVGHIMFTKAKVGATTQLCLAPLSVLPGYQRLGIGGQLIEAGHKIAQKLGFEYVILIGHPSYYPRFGYKNAADYGITTTMELPENVFMAINLQGKKTKLNGKIEFAKEFFE